MFCPECGKKLKGTPKFCLHCGSPIDYSDDENEEIEEIREEKKTPSPSVEKKAETKPAEEKPKKEVSSPQPDPEEEPEEEEYFDEEEEEYAEEGEDNFEEGENDEEEEEEEEEYFDDEDDEEDEPEENNKKVVENLNPETDPYWNDIVPEINEEIFRIPKDIIFKAAGVAVALIFVIVWLIYMLS